MDKDIVDGILFVQTAFEEVGKEQAREQWLVQLPWMSKGNYVSCRDYYYQLHPEKIKELGNKSSEEILAESEEILRKMNM